MAPQKTPRIEAENDAHDARRSQPQEQAEMVSESGPISRLKNDIDRAVLEGLGKQVKRALDRPISARLERRLQEQAWALTDGGRRDPMPVFLPAGEEGLGATAT